MHRDDEVILGPGEGDVQQPRLLRTATLLLDGGHVAERCAGHAARGAPAACRPANADPVAAFGGVGTAETGDDRDRELEALGGVDRHDPHANPRPRRC